MSETSYEIREAIPADGEALVAYMRTIAAEPHNGVTYSSAEEFTYTVEEERRLLADYYHSDDKLFLVAVADESIIGACNVRCGQRVQRYTAGLGITVHADWRNQGVGTALMQHAIDWARDNPQVKRLELSVFSNNLRAMHVYKKLGFEEDGCRRCAVFKHGEWLDMISMGVVFPDDTVDVAT